MATDQQENKRQQDKFWPKFTVVCDVCGSTNIRLDNSMGYSDMSGSWGSIDFVCDDCSNKTEIVSA